MYSPFSRSLKSLVPATLVAGTLVSLSAPAEALQFNFTYDPGTSLTQMIGYEMAGLMWASYLTDNVSVNLHVGNTSLLATNVIGGAIPGMAAYQNYGSFYNAMINDRLSTDDWTATNSLDSQQDSSGRKYYNGYLESESWNIYDISMTSANAKALGLRSAQDSRLDGVIMMNNLTTGGLRWSYDYQRTSAAAHNSLDFLSVITHEIGHNLGFISGVDSATKAESQATFVENQERVKRTTPLDMFRYSDYSKFFENNELAMGEDVYFSIDNGNTRLVELARGHKDFGLGKDGYQTSHWEDQSGTSALGIMGPTIRTQERRNIAALDVLALDVVGWNRNTSATINLSLLESQAKTKLANRLGVSVSWLMANQSTAAANIDAARDTEITAMLQDSQVYNWGTRPYSQEIWGDKAFNEQVSFETLDPADQVANVPEPGVTGGLLGVGFLSWVSRRFRTTQTA